MYVAKVGSCSRIIPESNLEELLGCAHSGLVLGGSLISYFLQVLFSFFLSFVFLFFFIFNIYIVDSHSSLTLLFLSLHFSTFFQKAFRQMVKGSSMNAPSCAAGRFPPFNQSWNVSKKIKNKK